MVSNLNLLESRRRILLNTPHIETVSDTIASFKTDIATRLKGCKIHFTPIQEGEGDPSPDNVRPITGWDGVTVTIPKGKNLLISDDPNKPYANYYHSSTGTTKYSEEENGFYSYGAGVAYPAHAVRNGIHSKLFIAPANMTITFSIEYKNVGTNYGIRFLINNNRLYDIHGSADEIWHKFSHTITMQKDDYIYLIIYSNIYWRNMQIEIGSVASDYEEYIEPTILTIPFPQTIYGGYVDLVKGEVVETWHKMTINDSSRVGIFPWGGVKTDSATGIEYVSALFLRESIDSKAYNRRDNMCDKLPYNTNQNHINTAYVYDGDSYGPCISLSTALIGTTQETLKQYLNGNPFNFCYQIRTPNTYPIDPQTLKALRGMNNIWSDANGNIEVSFYTH